MSIGTAIDRAVNAAIVALGTAANKFLDHFWPIDETEKVIMAATAEALADIEADNESWMPDELWAAFAKPNHPITQAELDHAEWWAKTQQSQLRRPFSDTDDFAEPLGEYPDLPPQGETK